MGVTKLWKNKTKIVEKQSEKWRRAVRWPSRYANVHPDRDARHPSNGRVVFNSFSDGHTYGVFDIHFIFFSVCISHRIAVITIYGRVCATA